MSRICQTGPPGFAGLGADSPLRFDRALYSGWGFKGGLDGVIQNNQPLFVFRPDRDEIYQVIDGSGTLMTGGIRVDPEDRFSGTRGGEARQIGVDDFVVIPAGTLHWFSQINGSITYVNIRLARP